MKPLVQALSLAAGLVLAALAVAALTGLAIHRDVRPAIAMLVSAGLVLTPPVAASLLARSRRVEILGVGASLWALGVFLAMPVYFPGERADALVTALSLGRPDVAEVVAGAIPSEAQPDPPVAETLVVQPAPAPSAPLRDHQIALPYEGDGRRLSVEIVVEHAGQSHELQFLLDTGATYTTLPADLLTELGVSPRPDDPVITLHTANGQRDARIGLLDRVWLGDLPLDGVAVATCDPCASDSTVGLLGLNVTGGYNLTIDADRREVVFSRRADFSRHLDIKPFVDVGATITRHPGRVSVEARIDNAANRTIERAQTSIHCRDETWLVDLMQIGPGEVGVASRTLPPHEPCERYQVGLHQARW